MPWCTECDRFLSPSTVRTDGTCPTCGRHVDEGEVATSTRAAPTEPAVEPDEEPLPPVPWHLKLLILAVVVYLAFRAYQGIGWLLG